MTQVHTHTFTQDALEALISQAVSHALKQAGVQAGTQAGTQDAGTPAPAGGRARDSRGRFVKASGKGRTRKAQAQAQADAPAPAPESTPAPAPVDIAAILASLPVGHTWEPKGISRRQVNQAISQAGGTWQSSAWRDHVNPTYTVGGMTFTFDNRKVWKDGVQRGITRTA